MKGPLYRSDDGKCEGTRQEVAAYERGLNPLAKFKFPWRMSAHGGWMNAEDNNALSENTTGRRIRETEADAIALLNLMPLVEELRQTFEVHWPEWRQGGFIAKSDTTTRNLLLAYEKALGIETAS